MTVAVPSYGPSGARGVILTSRAAVTNNPTRYGGSGFERLLIAAETIAAELDDRHLLDMERTALAMEQLDALVSPLDDTQRGIATASVLGRLCVLAPGALLEAVQRTKESQA